jgi:hypothetical protein
VVISRILPVLLFNCFAICCAQAQNIATTQEPKGIKVFFKGSETDVKPFKFGGTYFLSVNDVGKLIGQSVKLSEVGIEIGANPEGHLDTRKWNPGLTKNMSAASIRAMSAIQRFRDVMNPLSNEEYETKRYEVEADKAIDEAQISAESDGDKALQKMMFIYLYKIKITSSTMSLRMSQAASTRIKNRDRTDKLNEITPIYAQFIRDAEVCKNEIQAVMDAGSFSEQDAKSRRCVSAEPLRQDPSPQQYPKWVDK